VFDKIVGTGGATDASMKFTFHAPRDDASAQPVLNLGTGAFVTETDQARATGTWTPLNPAQSTTAVSSNTATDTITAKSLAVQKGVADLTHPGLIQPGDVLEYTINFQVSDFFAFQNALASDVISDGQHFDSTFTPTLQFTDQGSTSASAGFAAANYNVGARNTTDGTTPIGFGISNELIARAFSNGQLLGGSIPAAGPAALRRRPIRRSARRPGRSSSGPSSSSASTTSTRRANPTSSRGTSSPTTSASRATFWRTRTSHPTARRRPTPAGRRSRSVEGP